jgi:Tol biopolymer transport system component/DNA-binding winged helix-turn-helix (wHTH) protein
MSRLSNHFYEFGPFRLDAIERLLSRDGESVPLTPKAFDLLLVLVERHGHLLEKDELLKRVWPDTFIEEANLSYNISLIRKALGEGENGRRYIETVPKRGYRFVAEVREGRPAADDSASGAEVLPPERAGGDGSVNLPATTASPTGRARRWVWPAISLAVGLLVSTAVWWVAFRRPAELPPPRVIPFTSLRGNEMQPSFSPDGNQIAFVWDGEQGDNHDIYIKQFGNESLLRLTTNPAVDTRPCWSPDSRYIAFTRELSEGAALYLIPSLGGAERRITQLWSARTPYQFRISWSPDGEWLAVMDKNLPAETPSIYLVARETGEKRKLTAPPAGAEFDLSPVISPDGRMVVFVRLINNGVGDLYLVPTAGGEPQRLTFDNALIESAVWTPDNREILFLSMRDNRAYGLWRVPATGGTPVRVEAAGPYVTGLAVSRQGRRLAWSQSIRDYDIWRMELADAALPGGRKPLPPPSKLLISSTGYDLSPEFSPDGKSIAFASGRSGNFEIWVADSTGERPVQLTAFDRGVTGSPRWSPDSRQIVFDARPADSADIYVVSAEGGAPRRLTTDPAEDIVPSWSRDGKWIYFSSKRSGTSQIWKMPAAGGPAVQVTKHGGFDNVESPDGQFLYYTKVRAPGIWRRPVMGGEETFVLDHHRAGFWRYWTVVERGIYFATAERPEQPLIEFYSFATSQVTPVAVLEKGLNLRASGLAVSPDGRWLIWTQRDQDGSDIMLMENFR